MRIRGNDYDVSARINTTDSRVVNGEVKRIYLALYPAAPTRQFDHAFRDLTRLYKGEFPGYHPCDTPYHDLQHALEVTLAMARLIDGYERAHTATQPFGDSLFRLGVITALFHDAGYVRKLNDHRHANGAEYTLTHVSRGARFLQEYLPQIGMAEMAGVAAGLIHFTDFDLPAAKVKVPAPIYRLLGNMLGSADLIAQMSDRCYLEKCRDRLYPELVTAGLTTKRTAQGMKQVVFASGEDLLMNTPKFFREVSTRLEVELGGCHVYVEQHFGGQNPYLKEVNRNIQRARDMGARRDASMLKRDPPETLTEQS